MSDPVHLPPKRPLGRGPSLAAALSPRRAAGLFVAAVAASFVIGLTGLCRLGPVGRLDDALLDAFQRQFASGTSSHQAVVVDIDEVSLAAVGQWPWPRYRIANLIERVAAQGPSAIAMDIGVPEGDRASLANIKQV